MRRRAWIGLGVLPLLAVGGFMAWKTRAVARELVDPPFYRPQPLARVEATYRGLAEGEGGDPGGTWSSEEVDGLQLWRLRRREPAPGVVLLLHGFGDDRWGTSPALKWFPNLDAAIFTYRRRDDALRAGGPAPAVTFGARESAEVVRMVHHLEATGTPRRRIVLMGRSLGASVGLLALAALEREGRGPLGGIVWEGAPASTRSFAERLVRGPRDRWWHVLAPAIGAMASAAAGRMGDYDPAETDLLQRAGPRFATSSLCFLATEDRLAPPAVQRALAARFASGRIIEVPTWHLHCADVLGPRYAEAIREATGQWFQNVEGGR
ncbi:alpha/beta hydrolase [Geothrix sp. 21YS21S-4]|uniref:alpha/beta hydrolase n=1 Tax=Geothrix sp. 21YS21S-4 TaxID=3068889 RepID=UPI0027B9C3BB|nr:alpha/beta fold hydrolase [Geothrix sp. 21YS21S-4]